MVTEEKTLLDEYLEQGHVVVRGLLDRDRDLQPVLDEYSTVLDGLMTRLFDEGRVTSPASELPFSGRVSRLITETGAAYFGHFSPKSSVKGIKEGEPAHLGPAVFRLLRNPKVMDVAETILGPEIVCNPLNNVRIKPPERLLPEEVTKTYNSAVGKTNWHQDLYNFSEDAEETNFLTVWIPITSASVEHGCMVVVPGSHKGELNIHCPSRDPAVKGIPLDLVGAHQVALPMEPGDVLFMHGLTEHTALSNVSDTVRFSFDLRYSPLGEPTGLPGLPSWVVRSKAHPETEMTDPSDWVDMWMALKDAPDVDYGDTKRGNPEHPLCE